MKTQINKLVRGDHRENRIGTTYKERDEVALIIREENPEKMVIKIRNRILTLKAYWTISRKNVTYSTEIPLDLYMEFFGDFGLPQENPIARMYIYTDCTAAFTTNSKKDFIKYVSESEIEILNKHE